MLAAVPNDMAALQSTGLDMLVRDLERLRREDGAPVAVIDDAVIDMASTEGTVVFEIDDRRGGRLGRGGCDRGRDWT